MMYGINRTQSDSTTFNAGLEDPVAGVSSRYSLSRESASSAMMLETIHKLPLSLMKSFVGVKQR